jgi:GH15 family glucan-1,4-alpha-glucosidase
MYRKLADYALIGDCRSAALISRDGSIDWLCLPIFDSPSVFAALLDVERGGSFRVSAPGASEITRRYLGASNVLETTFHTASGVLRLTDLMPVADEAAKTRTLWPDHEILRRAECVDGQVDLSVVFEPRPDYGRARVELRRGGSGAVISEFGHEVLTIASDVPLAIDGDRRGARGTRTLRRGDRATVGLTFADRLPAVMPARGDHADQIIRDSVRWWEAWAAQCRYDWHYRDAVLRSALTLKLLTYAPSGAMIAAPTTSLPEQIGGIRNWDYRYCWLRDASLTLSALVDLGYAIEAEAFLSWVLHATRLTLPRLQILYDVYGETKLREHTLDHLEGYAGSRPVRIGNGATGQLQLDVYGEVVDAAYQYVVRGGTLDRTTAVVLGGLGRTICGIWREPDEGIWEPRSGPRQHTHSKVMCWVALDRLIELHRRGVPVDTEGLDAARDEIRQEIETHAWNAELNSYTAVFGGRHMDASLLRIAMAGYVNPGDARLQSTMTRVREELGTRGLLYRYLTTDGLPPGEGTFTICSFWSVQCSALAGRLDEAMGEFERVAGCANDLGLLSEEIDPESRDLLGNFPQAFSHIGLINAALAMAECAGRPRYARAAPTGAHKP